MMPHSPQRTSAAGLYEATGKGGALWCMGSCSQTFYHADGGMLDKYGYRTYREKKSSYAATSHFFILKGKLINCEVNIRVCMCMYLPLGVRHCNSLKIHTASPVAWMTSALDRTF